MIPVYQFQCYFQRFRSVVVITFALHAKGHGFEPRRNLILLVFYLVLAFYPDHYRFFGFGLSETGPSSHPLFVCTLYIHLGEVISILTPIDPKVYFQRVVQRQLSDPYNFRAFLVKGITRFSNQFFRLFRIILIADDPIFKKLFSAGDHGLPLRCI